MERIEAREIYRVLEGQFPCNKWQELWISHLMCFKERLGLEQRNQHEKDELEDKRKWNTKIQTNKLPFHAFKEI